MNGTGTVPRRPIMLALAGSALLVVLAAGAFYYATVVSRGRSPGAADEVTVTIAGKACDPNELTVPAGRRTFRIVNQSDRAVEWEILDGVMVVAERENIAPGISQTLTAKLVPGRYEITCGLLSNPRGTLVVTESAESTAEAARPPITSFIGPLAEYQVNLVMGANALVEATRALTHAIKAGDLDRARQLYLPARLAYANIEAAAARNSDLATAIDAQADYFERREQDPDFKGFHRLEYALFATGADQANLASVADGLLADVTSLQARLAKQAPSPEQPLDAAAALLAGIAQARVPHGGERYAHGDLAVIAAEVAASGRIVELYRPLLAKANPGLLTEVSDRRAAVDAALAGLRRPEGYVGYDTVDEAARTALAQQIQALADAVARIGPALGLQ